VLAQAVILAAQPAQQPQKETVETCLSLGRNNLAVGDIV
jgi:hypothetical protein